MTLFVLAPDGIAELPVGLHLLEEAFLDQGIDDLVCRATLQALWQWQGEAVGALRGSAEDDALGVGEFCHWVCSVGSRAGMISGSYEPEPRG